MPQGTPTHATTQPSMVMSRRCRILGAATSLWHALRPMPPHDRHAAMKAFCGGGGRESGIFWAEPICQGSRHCFLGAPLVGEAVCMSHNGRAEEVRSDVLSVGGILRNLLLDTTFRCIMLQRSVIVASPILLPWKWLKEKSNC